MRKSFICIISLFAISLGVLFAAHFYIDSAKDKVDITEKTLSGNIESAREITVGCNTQYSSYLFWETECHIGEELNLKTDFEFYQGGKGYVRTEYDYRGVMFEGIFSEYGMSSSGPGGINIEEEIDSGQLMLLPVIDVAKRAAAGEIYSETVDVGAYYEYYPLNIYFDFPYAEVKDRDENEEIIQDYFKIPVLSEHRMTVTIEKNSAGEIVLIETTSNGDGIYMTDDSVVTSNGCWFIVNAWKNSGEKVQIERNNGYGVYYLPYRIDENGLITPETDKIEVAFKLDEEYEEAISINFNADKNRILLVTREYDMYILTVLNADNGEIIQKIELFEYNDQYAFENEFINEECVVYRDSGGRGILISENDKNIFESQFLINFSEIEEIEHSLYYDTEMVYDGTRLAVVSSFGSFASNGFYLSVYEKDGMKYAGEFTHSSNRSVNLLRHHMTDDNPLTIESN